MGIAVGQKLATLRELQTFYGSQDLHDMIEVHIIDRHNEQRASHGNNGH